MSQTRLEWKVGLFVFAGLAVVAALVLNFTKSLSLFQSSYEVRLKTRNVGGLKSKAAVLLAGVPVGTVDRVVLAPDAKSVTLHLRILARHRIPGDALFNIDAQGFLGDNYVSITPTLNVLPPLRDGDERECREPFNFQDAARSALSLITRLDQTAQKIDDAAARVNRTILSDLTLSNFSAMVADFRSVAEHTRTVAERAVALESKVIDVLGRVDTLVATNSAPIQGAVSNLLHFTEHLSKVGGNLEGIVESNRLTVANTLRSFESAAGQVTNLLGDLQGGKGLAGVLLKDDALAREFQLLSANLPVLGSNANRTLTNLQSISADAQRMIANLNQFIDDGRSLAQGGTTLVSNLTRHGLLYKPKPPKSDTPFKPLLTPRQRSDQH